MVPPLGCKKCVLHGAYGKWEQEAGTRTTSGKCLMKDIMSIYKLDFTV